MTIRKYLCEKEWICGDGPDFVRVTVYEVEASGKSVTDITHHDSEALADDWLVKEWELNEVPKIGEQLNFKTTNR
jgi:hypothetical protein